ncbi:hypothetical protein ACH6CV_12835 [Bacillota bacterium Meth-B3]
MENQVRAATGDLEDLFHLLKWELNKGEHVMQAINERFFQRLAVDAFKPSPAMSRAEAIALDFDRAAAFADVLDDIIRRMCDMLTSFDTDSILDRIRTAARPQAE